MKISFKFVLTTILLIATSISAQEELGVIGKTYEDGAPVIF
jgi:hypothetical protein